MRMEHSTGAAKNNLSRLIRQVERGESVVITRHGKPVAQLVPVAARRRRVRLGAMKDRVRLRPGWSAPIDPDSFLSGDL
jgi:prevent-host-death family protein